MAERFHAPEVVEPGSTSLTIVPSVRTWNSILTPPAMRAPDVPLGKSRKDGSGRVTEVTSYAYESDQPLAHSWFWKSVMSGASTTSAPPSPARTHDPAVEVTGFEIV
eukprot:CAMPEP_0113729864 /NCGR_PEP_ID=MMETSP0038_2-20120614/42816_1 /TAXON_ID=2898 /ORGANISM="Cryptomonas paramecium" /LENGTH=106 /DNA_ID=CAMNT_0000661813 /DNA_START=397 /DNA_END=713 /DNA_ORIENTATION=- /assembly_acc=CAM_ASM_000170